MRDMLNIKGNKDSMCKKVKSSINPLIEVCEWFHYKHAEMWGVVLPQTYVSVSLKYKLFK